MTTFLFWQFCECELAFSSLTGKPTCWYVPLIYPLTQLVMSFREKYFLEEKNHNLYQSFNHKRVPTTNDKQRFKKNDSVKEKDQNV